MHKNSADLPQRIARLDKYVTIVAFLWLAMSLVLFLLAAPSHLNAAQHGSRHSQQTASQQDSTHAAARAFRM
jgi:preprotein translocase subunit SecG